MKRIAGAHRPAPAHSQAHEPQPRPRPCTGHRAPSGARGHGPHPSRRPRPRDRRARRREGGGRTSLEARRGPARRGHGFSRYSTQNTVWYTAWPAQGTENQLSSRVSAHSGREQNVGSGLVASLVRSLCTLTALTQREPSNLHMQCTYVRVTHCTRDPRIYVHGCMCISMGPYTPSRSMCSSSPVTKPSQPSSVAWALSANAIEQRQFAA